MPDPPSRVSGRTVSDPLTDMLRCLRLDGVDYGRCSLREPWGVLFPAQASALFHFIGTRGCWLQAPDGAWVELVPGDAVLLPRGSRHVLASKPGITPWPLERHVITPVCPDVYDVRGRVSGPDDPGDTLLFCGSMHFNVDPLHPMLRMMPEVMHAQALAEHEPVIPQLLDALVREVAVQRVGSAGILARLADVVAASIIRSWVERGHGDPTGWIAAMRSADVGKVLAAIHRDPGKDWTVPTLARLMGASRSGFAERFADVVGETPARYVARVRMHVARQWLARDGLRISVVARRLGYESDAAFSRAFKRIIGQSPGRLKLTAQPPRSLADSGVEVEDEHPLDVAADVV